MWPAPPPRRGPHPLVRTAARLLTIVFATAVIAGAAGTAFWLLEDEQGRDDIRRSLRDLPLVGHVVSDPDAQ